MNLQTLMDTILASTAEDWHKIVCWGANSGPSYRDAFTFFEQWNSESGVLRTESHAIVAAYKPDVSITMASGLTALEDFKEPWANKFPDSNASSAYVDVFYNNALIFRDVYVTVDGGRARLPLPKSRTTLEVPRRRHDFIRLVESLEGASQEFDRYFRDAGFEVVEEPWPRF